MEHWYRFLAHGSQPIYGHGTLGQAFQFAGRLNRARDVIYSTTMVTDGRRRGRIGRSRSRAPSS
jgi:hypothetical protein